MNSIYNYDFSKINNSKVTVSSTPTHYITFKKLNELPYLRHCFTTKAGGVSEGMFSTLNLSFSRGDKEEHVRENYKRICSNVGFCIENIVMSDQIHKTDIANITQELLESLDKEDLKNRKLKNIDAMITNLKNVPLFTYYADCVPLYFVDTKLKVIGMSHSGWRGTANLMGLKTIQAMTDNYASNPSDIICAIGPSICQDCYEVSDDVIDELTQSFIENKIVNENELPELYYKKNNNKYQLNLWKANYFIIKKAGVKPENIIISDICTCHNSDLLFSHRATNGKRGNLAAAIQLI